MTTNRETMKTEKKKEIRSKKGKPMNVPEMIREVTENNELADRVKSRIRGRQIIDQLMALRSSLVLSSAKQQLPR